MRLKAGARLGRICLVDVAEYGFVMPVGESRFRAQVDGVVHAAELSGLAKFLFRKLNEEYRILIKGYRLLTTSW